MRSVDAYVSEVAGAVARRMTATGLPGRMLREREHLDPFIKDEFESRSGVRPVARTLSTPDFPGLGPVDVVAGEPNVLMELKWSYQAPGKLFESAWDIVKLALLAERDSDAELFVATGASVAEWRASETRDLFENGEIDPAEVWGRSLTPPRGPNHGRTVGEDLVIGARGNQPLRAHTRIKIQRIAAFEVDADFELRLIRVAPAGSVRGWPGIETSADVPRRSAGRTARGSVTDVRLPARVTQAWIERTAPALTKDAVAPFLQALQSRGWTEADLEARVRPHLPTRD